jgi:hypothetical protein
MTSKEIELVVQKKDPFCRQECVMNQLRLFGIVLRCSNVHTSTFKNECDTLKRFFVLLSVAHSFLSVRTFDETRKTQSFYMCIET